MRDEIWSVLQSGWSDRSSYRRSPRKRACGQHGTPELIKVGAAVDARTPAGKTALHLAVEAGKLDVVRALSARADVQALLPGSDQSVLHLACHERANEIAMELLRAGGDPDAPDAAGVTPLMIAVRSNMIQVVNEMIGRGAKPPASATLGLIEHCRDHEMKEMLEVVLVSGWAAEGPLPSLTDAPDGVSVPLDSTCVRRVVHAELGSSVRRCIPGEFEPSAEDSVGCVPLHLAAQAGNLEILAELLNSRRERGAASTRGVSPVHLAAEVGQAKIVDTSSFPESSEQTDREKGKAGALPVDVQDAEGQCPLHYAASNGQTEAIGLLLEAGAAIDCRDRSRRTPLHVAAKKGEVEAVVLLLRAGALFDVRDSSDCSPLSEAMAMKKDNVVDALLAVGASACSASVRGETPLHEACRRRPSVIPALIAAGAQAGHCWNKFSRTPLHVAAQAGQIAAAKQLLPLLSLRQVNLRDRLVNAEEGGDTALLVAVRNRHVEMVELLLGAGADPKVSAGSSKLSPLHVATSTLGVGNNRKPEARIARALIAAGADVHEIAPIGMTPLQAACLHGGHEGPIRTLLDAGADVSSPCPGYRLFPPVLLAACVGNAEALRVLVKSPRCGVIDMKGPAPYRFTSLSLAVKHGHAEVVRVLLEEGADMEALPLGEQGDSPEKPTLMHLAASLGHRDIVSLLLQAMLLKEESMVAT